MNQLLTTEQAARILRVSVPYFRNLVSTRRIKPCRKVWKNNYFDSADINKYLKDNQSKLERFQYPASTVSAGEITNMVEGYLRINNESEERIKSILRQEFKQLFSENVTTRDFIHTCTNKLSQNDVSLQQDIKFVLKQTKKFLLLGFSILFFMIIILFFLR